MSRTVTNDALTDLGTASDNGHRAHQRASA